MNWEYMKENKKQMGPSLIRHEENTNALKAWNWATIADKEREY
jgi:hypothetical protein